MKTSLEETKISQEKTETVAKHYEGARAYCTAQPSSSYSTWRP
jgi:hypothetical protein